MKFTNIRFLAKANISGRENSLVLSILIVILVMSMSIIPSFTKTIDEVVDGCKKSYRGRLVEIEPFDAPLTNKVISGIKKINHVENVFIESGLKYTTFIIKNIDGNDAISDSINSKAKKTDTFIWSRPLIGEEKIKVIAGKDLDNSPEFSCLIPSLFYPFSDKENDLDYIDGRTLIGKTITFNADESLMLSYNYNLNNERQNDYAQLKAINFKMKVVGVFDCGPTSVGSYYDIFYSAETGQKIVDQSLKASGVDWKNDNSPLAQWRKTPSLQNHYVLIDKNENVPYVFNKLNKLDVCCSGHLEQGTEQESETISTLLKVIGLILTIAVGVSCIVIYIQNSVNILDKRRSEVGLLKAIGYKNKQIYFCLLYETMSRLLKALMIGAIISTLFIAISNLRNNHSTMHDMMYIVNWYDFLVYLEITIVMSVAVPLICQLFILRKLVKIQPKESMESQ